MCVVFPVLVRCIMGCVMPLFLSACWSFWLPLSSRRDSALLICPFLSLVAVIMSWYVCGVCGVCIRWLNTGHKLVFCSAFCSVCFSWSGVMFWGWGVYVLCLVGLLLIVGVVFL